MSYIRIKKIKGHRYAYLVENKYKKRGPRQKVKQYLGKVITLERIKDIDFFDFYEIDSDAYTESASKEQIVDDLLRWELKNHGFSGKDLLSNGSVLFDVKAKRLTSAGKPCILEMNEGFFCEHNLKKVTGFMVTSEDDHQVGLELANALVDCGLKVPQEVFIALFSKL